MSVSLTHLCLLQLFAYRWIGSFQLFFAFALSFQAAKLSDAGYFQYVVMSGSGLFLTRYCILVIGAPCLADKLYSLVLLSFVAHEQFGLVSSYLHCLTSN